MTPDDTEQTPPVGSNGTHLPSAPNSINAVPRVTPPGGLGGGVVDGQFMPHQSQIFVFSTGLANQAADSVHRGLCRSIVDFHLDQPATKQFLEV